LHPRRVNRRTIYSWATACSMTDALCAQLRLRLGVNVLSSLTFSQAEEHFPRQSHGP
jgi:hypothetical protein